MKRLGKKIIAGALAAAICTTSVGLIFAADKDREEKGILSSVSGWFTDRGSDIGNAASVKVQHNWC